MNRTVAYMSLSMIGECWLKEYKNIQELKYNKECEI